MTRYHISRLICAGGGLVCCIGFAHDAPWWSGFYGGLFLWSLIELGLDWRGE